MGLVFWVMRRACTLGRARAKRFNKVDMMLRSNCVRRAALFAAITTALVLQAPAQAEQVSGWGLLNMTQGVTDMSRKIYDLHMLIFWVCVWIALAVFGVMIWSIVRYRKSAGAVADTTM